MATKTLERGDLPTDGWGRIGIFEIALARVLTKYYELMMQESLYGTSLSLPQREELETCREYIRTVADIRAADPARFDDPQNRDQVATSLLLELAVSDRSLPN